MSVCFLIVDREGLLMWRIVLVLSLRDCWFGRMIGRIRLVGARVMREGEESATW